MISQSPKPGIPLKEGDKVTIIVSDGPKPKVTKTVKVDNIVIPYEASLAGEKNHKQLRSIKKICSRRWISQLRRER